MLSISFTGPAEYSVV